MAVYVTMGLTALEHLHTITSSMRAQNRMNKDLNFHNLCNSLGFHEF